MSNAKDPGKSLLQRLSRKTNFRARSNKSTSGPYLIGDAIDEFVDNVGWHQPKALAEFHSSFAQIVGEEIAEHVVIEKFHNGELILRADGTAWATQLKYLTPVMLEKIQQAAPQLGVSSVKVLPPTTRKTAGAWRIREGKRR